MISGRYLTIARMISRIQQTKRCAFKRLNLGDDFASATDGALGCAVAVKQLRGIVQVSHEDDLIDRYDLRVPKLVICEGRNGNAKQISSAFTAVQLVVVLCGLFPTPK